MKVYITTDMEGISGIVSEEQTFRTGSLYERGKKLFVGDVNAAVEGAYAGGADEIIVADFHAGWYNIMIDELSPKAKLLSGGAGGGPKFALSGFILRCDALHRLPCESGDTKRRAGAYDEFKGMDILQGQRRRSR